MVESRIHSLWIVGLLLLSVGVGEAAALAAPGESNNLTASPSAEQNGTVTAIDSCTNITTSGEYELVADVQTEDAGTCIHIEADNVSLDGNGHTIEGPGGDEGSIGIGHPGYPNFVHGTEIRNVEIVGWDEAYANGQDDEVANAVIRDNGYGLDIAEGEVKLTDTRIENNSLSLAAERASVTGTNVTVRNNDAIVECMDAKNVTLESSRIVNNDDNGAGVGHGCILKLDNSTVSGNDGHGIATTQHSHGEPVIIENTRVAANAGDGVRGWGEPFRLDDVTVENNAGQAVNVHPSAISPWATTETTHAGGPSVTVSDNDAALRRYEESLRLDPVDPSNVQPREDGTFVGGGLNVSANVSGTIEVEMDVETDDGTVALWRYDGAQWETVEEDLAPTDGTVAVSIEENGTYAPGVMNDETAGDEHVLRIQSTDATPAMHYHIVSNGTIEPGDGLEEHDEIVEEDGQWVIEGQVGPAGTDTYDVSTAELASFGTWHLDDGSDSVNDTDNLVSPANFSLQWDGEDVHPADIAVETHVGGGQPGDSNDSGGAAESPEDQNPDAGSGDGANGGDETDSEQPDEEPPADTQTGASGQEQSEDGQHDQENSQTTDGESEQQTATATEDGVNSEAQGMANETDAEESSEEGTAETGTEATVTAADGSGTETNTTQTSAPAVADSNPAISAEGPGFGVISVLVAVIGAGLVMYRRLDH